MDQEILGHLRNNGWQVNGVPIFEVAPRTFHRNYPFYNLWAVWHYIRELRGRYPLWIENVSMHRYLFLVNGLAAWRGQRILIVATHLEHHTIESRWEPQPWWLPVLIWMDKCLETWFSRPAWRYLAISQSTRQDLLSLGVDADKIRVVYPGVDQVPVLTERNRRFNKGVQVLFVGACGRIKGLRYLIEAMAHLKKYSASLHVVGDTHDDGSYVAYLKELVAKAGLTERVRFLGRVPQDELWSLYRQADIFVLPSLWEGYGIVLLEAMQFGLPIVATRVGAIPELVQDGQNGLLVPPGDTRCLAGAIERLILSPELRHQLGENGRSRGSAVRSWREVGEEAAQLIEECR